MCNVPIAAGDEYKCVGKQIHNVRYMSAPEIFTYDNTTPFYQLLNSFSKQVVKVFNEVSL